MSNLKISQLSSANTLDGTELVPIVQTGQTNTVKTTTGNIASLGSRTVASLTDANISSPANNQALQYQTSDHKWHNTSTLLGLQAFAATQTGGIAVANFNTQSTTTHGVIVQRTAGNPSNGNALLVTAGDYGTDANPMDSTVGISGYELGKGTIKVTHNKPIAGTVGSDANASALSINLAGTNSAAQGIFIDTATTNTYTGKLLNVNSETSNRLTLTSVGQLQLPVTGSTGGILVGGDVNLFRTSANIWRTDDEFDVVRATGSTVAYVATISGSSPANHVVYADGKHEWGSGTATRDTNLYRSQANRLKTDTDFEVGAALHASVIDTTVGSMIIEPAASLHLQPTTFFQVDVGASSSITLNPGSGGLIVGSGGTTTVGGNIFLNKSVYQGVNTSSITGSVTVDASLFSQYKYTLTGNVTFTFSGAQASYVTPLTLYLIQDGTGSRTVTWPGNVVWVDGIAPTLSTAPGSLDGFQFESIDGGTSWLGTIVHQGAWKTYTPTFQNLTLGNGSVLGRYVVTGHKCSFVVQITIGSTTTNTLPAKIILPVNRANNVSEVFNLVAENSAGNIMSPGQAISGTADRIDRLIFTYGIGGFQGSGGFVIPGQLDIASNVPFALSSGDKIIVNGTYEI